MRKKLFALVEVAVLCGAGGMALAALTTLQADFGNKAVAHVRAQGLLPTNNPQAVERDKGLAHSQQEAPAQPAAKADLSSV
jgi:hypothetical protein